MAQQPRIEPPHRSAKNIILVGIMVAAACGVGFALGRMTGTEPPSSPTSVATTGKRIEFSDLTPKRNEQGEPSTSSSVTPKRRAPIDFSDLIPTDLTPCGASFPASGLNRDRVGGARVAPFSVITEAGQSYFIKLEDSASKRALTYFLRGGERLDVKVPLGRFKLKYATGSAWCGEARLFGSDTQRFEAIGAFIFEDDGQGFAGHTVRLIMRTDGNLQRKHLEPGEF